MEEAEACLMRLEGTAEAQRAALQHGLQLTSTVRGPAGQPPADAPPGEHGSAQPSAGGDAAAAVRRQRLRLLQHLERLDTAIMLMNGAWRPPAFAALRDCTAAEAAGALAAAGRLPAVLVLLARHPRALLPSILDVLSAVPETVDAKQLAPLLRQVASLRKPSPLPREPDWVESAATAAELREAGQYALLLATEPMCAASGAGRGSSSGGSSGGTSGGAAGWHPPTERQLAAWVCERAQQLDATTGQLPNALALLEAGGATLHYGQPSISALLVLGQELLSLIKLVTSRGDGSSTWHMDLRQYAALSPAQRLSLLLGLLGGDSLADDLALHVAPFLARLGSGGSRSGQDGETADPQVVLRQALEAESVTRLGWVVRLIQSEARQPAVFSDAAQLAKTVGACCYACQATDAWELLNSMLSAARDALRADHSLGRDEQEAAAEGLAAVRGHVTAARLLTKHGLTTPVSTVRDADRAAALRLLRTLLARVSRTKNTESRWVEVWMDARSIQEHGFGQLSEEEVRTEFCRALLRAGQYRLCSSYLKPLRPEAAEQLVLAAGREVYLSASSMTDRAVKQAKECFSLLPASAAAREQLAGIAAAEQLQKLGLDLPPLQLQQLHAQAAAGDTQALEQLLAEHPKLLAADSGTLGQLAAALGLEQQQQPLLLRAAAAAHAAGELRRAESLLRVLVEHRYRPAWQLAATVSQDARCRRGELLAFALASAPADQLLALLLQWQAADSGQGSDCWGLFSAADAAADSPDGWAEQQRWLARQLRLHLIALGRSSACGGTGGGSGDARGSEACSGAGSADEAFALGCLLALGPPGLLLWEKLLSEQLPRPLGSQQRRRALLLGLTAAALLALQPAEVEPAGVAAAAAAAQARLEAPPAELLRSVQQQQRRQQAGGGSATAVQQQAPAGSEGSSTPPLSGAASDAGEPAGSSDVPVAASGTARAAAVAAASMAAAAAAAAAAERFHGLLLAAADAEQLQRLLPGVDAAAALAGGPDSRRRLVLQLAAAAGKPAALRAGGAAAGSSVGRSQSQAAHSPRQPHHRSSAEGSPGGREFQRAPSRKKLEALSAPGQAAGTAAAAGIAAAALETPAAPGSPRQGSRRFSAAEAREMLQQATALAATSGVAAWEVHLAFVEALLSHNQQLWGDPGAAAATDLLEASLSQLLRGPPQAAAGLLQALLLRVLPACSSRWPQHLCCCLQLMQRCAEALAAAAGRWQAAAAAFAACHVAAGQLRQAAASMDAKLFIEPFMQLLVGGLPELAASASNSSEQAAAPSVDAAALNQQLVTHVSSSNVGQLAAAVERLRQQHAATAAAVAGGGTQAAYPCSGGTVHLALFCTAISTGSRDAADAVQLCQECLGHMSPMHAAAAAAFAAAKGPCPLVLPPGGPQLAARTLPEEQQLAILGSALDIVASAEASADAVAALEADAAPGELLTQLRQRHALLSALASLAACCPAPAQQRAARAAAAALQQAAQDGDSSSAASSPLLAHCLQQLLTAGCPAPGVLQATAMLQALQQQPEQAPPDVHAALAAPAAAAAAQQAVGSAAEAAVAPALHAMSGSAEQNAAGQSATDGQPLSAGDAVQNLFALLRSLHHLPETSSSPALDKPSAVAEAAAADAAAEAVGTLRVRVWQQLQQHAAQYDGSGGAAATEAHLQVLELLGSIGTTMWPGWSPPAAALLPSGGSDSNPSEPAQPGMLSSHQRALLFTRTAAVLAQEWPTALQQCRLSAADFGSAEAAEAALLQLAAAAEGPQHLRLLLHLLQEGLADAFPPAAAEPEPTGALAATDVALQPPAAAENKAAAGQVLPEAAASRQQPVAPLHRVWASSLRMLLPFGDLDGALAALEQHSAPQEQQQQQAQQPAPAAAPLTEEEAAALLEAADATQGAAAAAALALLLPNRRLCRARWQQLLQACSSGATGAADLAAALPGLSSLLLLLVQQQQAPLAELAADQHAQQQLLKVLLAAALQQQAAAQAYCTPLGSSALTLRMAVAAAAAAQLVEARQYTAAAWVAMQVSGTPRLLRVLDNATRVLQQLLRSCAAGSPAAAAAAAAVRKLDSGAAPPGLALPHTAAALLRGLPERCAAALARMNADLQL